MRLLPNRLILLVAFCFGISQAVTAAPDRDRDSGASSAPAPYNYSGGGPTPGTCDLGIAERDLDVNGVLARVFNTGSLFFGNTTTAGNGYLVPQASQNSPIFASGIWIGGKVNGEIRVAGARYTRYELWPGPLNADGTLPNPNDCTPFDRIYRVSKTDIQDFEGGAAAARDLADWPAELGAPVIAALNNGIDDDDDGLIDEGTDGISNDDDNGDGTICSGNALDPCPDGVDPDFIDERDEQERVVASVRGVDLNTLNMSSADARDAARAILYDLAAGDRPEIIGDQALWWVMNDVGNIHQETGSDPLGVEVRVHAWSFSRADALGETTFYKYTVENKSGVDIEEAYLSVFSDPDLGDAADDWIGSDTTLSLGFVYNGTLTGEEGGTDNVYGVPPAEGYDFFQGPIVALDEDGIRDDTLGLTRFTYFCNGCPEPATTDPRTKEEYYNHMLGLWKDGVPFTASGFGYQTEGEETKFVFPGDPVANECWSMRNDCLGEIVAPADQRLIVHTGPFTMEPDVPQDIVFGIIHGQGSTDIQSVAALRAADQLAQAAYDADFELASPPPAPPLCDVLSTNAERRPGSGFCLEAIEQDGQLTLLWGYPTSSPNYLGSYTALNRLLPPNSGDDTYDFEGFNIYRYPTSGFAEGDRMLIATYDLVNGVTLVRDERFDANVGVNVPFIAANGSDSGIQYTHNITGLTNYTDYFFGVSAYAYIDNDFAVGSIINESTPRQITVRPSQIAAGNGGQFTTAEVGEVIVATRITGDGVGAVTVQIVDPMAITGATYRIEPTVLVLADSSEVISYRVLRGSTVILDGAAVFDATGVVVDIEDSNFVLDGLLFAGFSAPFPDDSDNVLDIAGDGQGIIELSYGGDDTTCPDPNEGGDSPACDVLDSAGNTVFLDGNINDDYYMTAGGGTGSIRVMLNRLERYIEAGQPTNFEMRFTDACATVGACLAIHGFASLEITSVPFELWNIGDDIDDPGDDIRMIPFLNANDAVVDDWTNNFSGADGSSFGSTLCSGAPCMVTDWVYYMQPDRPNGYDLFNAAAAGFGGPGSLYDRASDGDTQVDPDPFTGLDCGTQGVYVLYCYENREFRSEFGGNGAPSGFIYPIGRTQIADLAEDGTTPPAGTTIRINVFNKPLVAANDIFEFSTAELALTTGDALTAAEALDLIAIVPNPYMGQSAYETGNLSRVVRFTNLPEEVTIRVYTVSGSLVRTFSKDGPSRSLNWNLTSEANLPIASGMYLIHVDVPGVGERVLKFGVVQRRTRITIF